ncbi:TlpA family protein disulfide reductase [Alteromonas sp. A079]|uniref:TlpA family protein disulfide reductase n=1 Tax=Alteromonas sp. A079 TaxID=3410268 RepID=UPI003BA2C342
MRKLALLLLFIVPLGVGVFVYQSQQFDFETLDGTTHSWSDMQGEWVVINYFAPWCAPCLREMPELNAFSNALPSNTRLFAINYDRLSREDLSKLVTKYDIELNVIFAQQNTTLPLSKPAYLPATFIIGPDGKVKETIMGEVTEHSLKTRLHSLKES